MLKVTVEILDEKVLNILRDLELMDLIKLQQENLGTKPSDINWAKEFKGKMTKTSVDEIDEQLNQLRKEWEWIYLWDTNIVVYYLQQQLTPSAETFLDDILSISRPTISVITEIELLCWNTITERDATLVRRFLDECLVVELTKDIKHKTATIRKSKKIKLPDAIIAATASIGNFQLLTRNVSDFNTVEGLTLINPFDN